MKSLSRSTPLVRTNISNGGSSDVYMCLSMVSAVIVSGLGRVFRAERLRPVNVGDMDSGESVGDEAFSSLSSASDLEEGEGDASLMVGKGSLRSTSKCLVRRLRVMRDCENGLLLGSGGERYSSTVDRIAVVISSREV